MYYLDRLDVVERQHVIWCIHVLSMASGRVQGLLKGKCQLRPVHRSQFLGERTLLVRIQLLIMPQQVRLSRGQERGLQPGHLRSKAQRNFGHLFSRAACIRHPPRPNASQEHHN